MAVQKPLRRGRGLAGAERNAAPEPCSSSIGRIRSCCAGMPAARFISETRHGGARGGNGSTRDRQGLTVVTLKRDASVPAVTFRDISLFSVSGPRDGRQPPAHCNEFAAIKTDVNLPSIVIKAHIGHQFGYSASSLNDIIPIVGVPKVIPALGFLHFRQKFVPG